ncbi:MAG: hypothetical protein AAB353_11355 [Candidatus Hydrogenedentota bacterium]
MILRGITALIWEQWRRTYLALIGVLALTVMICTYVPWGIAHMTRPFTLEMLRDSIEVFVLWPGMLICLGMALLADSNEHGLRSRFPGHRFRLPMPNWVIVTTVFGYRLSAVWASSVVIAFFSYRVKEVDESFLYIAGVVAAIYCVLQAAYWSAGDQPIAKLLAATLLITALLAIATAGFTEIDVLSTGVRNALLFCAIAGSSLAASIMSVRLQRSGGSAPAWRFFSYVGAPDRPFRDPVEAQQWFEWRAHGMWLPICAWGAIAAILVGFAALGLKESDGLDPARVWAYSAQTVPMSAVAGLLTGAVAAGMIVAVAGKRPRWLGAHQFVLVRPTCADLLSLVRIRVIRNSFVIAVVPITLLVLFVGIIPELFGLEKDAPFNHLISDLRTGLYADAPWQAIGWISLAWIACWFANVTISVVLFVTCIVLPTAIYAMITSPGSELPRGLPSIVWVLHGLLAAAVILAFCLAIRKRLIDNNAIVVSFLIWPCVAMAIWRFNWSLNPGNENNALGLDPLLVFGSAAVASLAVVPNAVVPLMMHWARGR